MKHFKRILKKITAPKIVFMVFLCVLMVPNVILTVTEPLSLPGMLVNIILPLGLYWVLLAASPKLGRTMWVLFPLVFLAAFQIVLLSLYGRSVISVDMFLNLATTNSGEVRELLSNMWPTLIVVLLLYVLPLAISARMWRCGVTVSHRLLTRLRLHGVMVLTLGLAMLAVCLCVDSSYSMSKDLYPVNVGYNVTKAVNHTVKKKRYADTSRDFSFDACSVHADSLAETYVLVIGETSRADHWHINGYERNTTPLIESISKDEIYNFCHAMSESNTTHKSVPLMLSHLTPENYGDSIYSVKSLITAFKEAGFETVFISGQKHNGSFIDFFGAEADTCIFVREPDGLNLTDAKDLVLVDILDELLKTGSGRKRLFVLHTYGSHFNYRDRYSHDFARFTPDTYHDAVIEKRHEIINAYDNTIIMTDWLLHSITEVLRRQYGISAMVYTSDHGEDIFDDGRRQFLHASPCPSFYQLRVPFLVWLSKDYLTYNPDAGLCMKRNARCRVSSNSSFFNTIIDLAGIVTPCADMSFSVASSDFQEHPRLYLNDHNEAVALDECGFTSVDMALLKALDGH